MTELEFFWNIMILNSIQNLKLFIKRFVFLHTYTLFKWHVKIFSSIFNSLIDFFSDKNTYHI